MSNYGEHSSEAQMSRIKRGNITIPWSSNKPRSDTAPDWITGKLSITDINKYPAKSKIKD